MGAKVEAEGRITVPARLMSNFISNLPAGDTVLLESDGQALKIASGGYQVKIKGLDAQEFPIIPQQKTEEAVILPAQKLKMALSRLLPCVALNETRIELTGVNMIFTESELHLAATDSFRLAEEVIALDAAQMQEARALLPQGSCILPAATLVEVLRVVSPETKEVRLAFEDTQIFFEVDGVQILSRLISGRFPDYKQIIPSQFSQQSILTKEALLRAVKIATVFTSQASQEVVFRLRPEENKLIVESRSQEMGENQTSLEAETVGSSPLDLVFNPRYVLDGINAIATSRMPSWLMRILPQQLSRW